MQNPQKIDKRKKYGYGEENPSWHLLGFLKSNGNLLHVFWLKRYCGGESKEVSATKEHHAKGEIIVKGETHKRQAHFSLGLLKWQMHWPDLRQLQMGGHLSIKRCQEGCEKLWTATGTHGVSQPQLSNRGQSFFPWSEDRNLNASLLSGASHPLQAPLLATSSWPLLTMYMERVQLHAHNGSWEGNEGFRVAVLEAVNN